MAVYLRTFLFNPKMIKKLVSLWCCISGDIKHRNLVLTIKLKNLV